MATVFLLRRSRPSLQRAIDSVDTLLGWEVIGSNTSVLDAVDRLEALESTAEAVINARRAFPISMAPEDFSI